MANKKISELTNLPLGDIERVDLLPIVDITSLSTPTGETKNVTVGDLADTLYTYIGYPLSASKGGTGRAGLTSNAVIVGNGNDQVIQVSSSTDNLFLGIDPTTGTPEFKLVNINDSITAYPLSASKGGTGISSPTYGTVLVGQDSQTLREVSGSEGQVLSITDGDVVFKSGIVSSSNQINDLIYAGTISGAYSSGGQDVIDQIRFVSESMRSDFIRLRDVPNAYITNSLVVTNPYGTGLEFLSEPTPAFDNFFGGKTFAYGTFYFNGNIKERIYSNIDTSTIYNGTYSSYFEDFIHSGNIFYDSISSSVYFCRGTWPRRMGTSSADMHGFTWRETTPTGSNTAEAICRTRDDGGNFEVLLDLYTNDINGSGTGSVKDGSTYVVSEPSAVVYDSATDKIFFSCRNDHDASIIYRMDATGTQTSRAASIEVWVEMAAGDLKIDSLDIATTPASYFAVDLPPVNTRYLYFGVSPDYNSGTNVASTKHAAVLRVPTTGDPIGKLLVDYPVAYTVHLFWASSFDTSTPRMDRTGVKGIKVFFAASGGGEWTESSAGPVQKENSRIYVVSSGARSVSGVIATDSKSNENVTKRTISLATDQPIQVGYHPGQIVPVGYNGTSVGSDTFRLSPSQGTTTFDHTKTVLTGSDGYPQVPTLQLGDNYPGSPVFGPGIQYPTVDITPPMGDSFAAPSPISGSSLNVFDNEQFGGHALLELLVGEVYDDTLIDEGFSADYDSLRPYKTWRRGSIVSLGAYSKLSLGFDDPSQPIGTIGSGIGVARGIPFSIDDRLFISTSPEHSSDFDGQTPEGSAGGHGLVKLFTAGYALEGTDGVTAVGQNVMVIPVLANTMDQTDTTMSDRSQSGLQQVVIDAINQKFYIADFNHLTVYGNTMISSDPHVGYLRFAGIPAGSYENEQGQNIVNWTAVTSSVTAPYLVGNPISTGFGYTGEGNNYYPSIWNFTYPQTVNPLNSSSLGSHPAVAADTIGVDAYTDSVISVFFSKFGTIYEGDLFVYSRENNGERLFNNADPEIAYSRPCGLAGYNVGPNNEFRLIYTNGENNYTLLSSSLGTGIYINGLSRTFVKDNVLAGGRNIASVTDAGAGTIYGGILISFTTPSNTSDYVVLSQGSQGEDFGTGQFHNGNPALDPSGDINLTLAQANASVYYAKNKSQFRLTYTGSLPQVLHFCCLQ